MAVLPRNFSPDPIEQFGRWFDDAKACKSIEQANTMCLSTVDLDGFPDGRMVLLKNVDAQGFVFYSNFNSVKGRSLAALQRAALTFYWEPLHRQIRVQGRTERVSEEEADAYWATRPRLSQLGAWASLQSEPLDRLRTFIQRLSDVSKKYDGLPIPRPSHWSGQRVIPQKIEFWRSRRGRLHERFLYLRTRSAWTASRLYP